MGRAVRGVARPVAPQRTAVTEEEGDGSLVARQTPKTRKGKKVLENRLPQVIEPSKKSLFMKGAKASVYVQSLLKELHALRKPESLYLSSRGQTNCFPLDDPQNAEYLCQKNDCSLFCLGSTTKKHPFRLIFGRTFNKAMLDAYEFEVENYRPRNEFISVPPNALGSKPLIVLQGPLFDATEAGKRVKNLLTDFFSGPKAPQLCLQGIDHAIVMTAVESPVCGGGPTIRFRHYRLDYVKTGAELPRVELRELGPSFNLRLGRSKLPDTDVLKAATKVPREVSGAAKTKATKNVTTSALAETRGRIFLEPQDLKKLHTPHHHGDNLHGRRKRDSSTTSG